MKTCKKIAALVLTVLMIVSCISAVMAAEVGTIEGDTVLFAPAVGTYSKIDYVLKDASGNIVEDAALSLAEAHDGVSTSGMSLILNGTTLKSGKVYLSAASSDGSVTATLNVTISDTRLFFDAESNSTGDVLNTVLPKLISTGAGGSNITQLTQGADQLVVKEEANGNKYLYNDDDAYITMNPKWVSTNSTKTQQLTLSVKIKNHGDYVAPNTYYTLVSPDGVLLRMTTPDNAANGHKAWEVLTRVEGNDATAAASGVVLGSSWTDLKIRLDYKAQKYSVYMDGVAIWEDYTMLNAPSYLSQLHMRTSFDDLAIYSGDEYEPVLPYDIEGADSVYLPGAGKTAAIPYVLKNKSDGSVVSDAVYSVTGSGVELQADGTLLVNGSTPAGTVAISAYSPSNPFGLVATKAVTIESGKWWYDFEDRTVGGSPWLTGSSNDVPKPGQLNPTWKTTFMILGETDEEGTVTNKYFGWDADHATYPGSVGTNDETIHRVLNLDRYFTGKTTVEFDFLLDETSNRWHIIFKSNFSGGASTQITYNNGGLNNNYTSTGASGSVYRNISLGWHHMMVELDKATYTVYVDGDVWCQDYTNREGKEGYINGLYWGCLIDNLSIYTGENYRLVPQANVSKMTIPAVDSNSYSLSALCSDGSSSSKELTFSLAENYEGISISGNTITVGSTASVEPIKVNVTDGFTSGTGKLHLSKNYVLVNGSAYTPGADVITEAGSYTIRAAYGDSTMYKDASLFIAHYAGDKLIGVQPAYCTNESPMELGTEYAADFGATDTAKVFIWNKQLQPVEVAVEIH